MSIQALITCLLFVVVILLLIWQPVHPIVVGALIPAVLATCGIIKAGDAYKEFGNTTVIFFLSLSVVGEAFFKTGLADYIGGKIIGLIGKNEKGLILGTGIVAGGLSAFLNDTGSTACLMPIVGSMADKAGVAKSKLLMALAFLASLGGTITLVGTTPHIVTNGILESRNLRQFGFFEYTKIGVPLLIVGLIYMIFVGTKFLPVKDIEIKGSERQVVQDKKRMKIVGAIFIGVMIAMATKIVPMQIAGVFGAILVVLTGCISLKEAINSFSTTTIFLVGGIFPISRALVNTKAAEFFVNMLKPVFSGLSPIVLVGGIALLMLVMTQFLLNSSATVLMLPIAIMCSEAAGINPLAAAMAVSVSASGVFTTPFGTGPNLLVWEAGEYSIRDYFKCGLPLLMIFWLTTTALCCFFYL